MKWITKYIFIVLSVVLLVITLFDYLDYLKLQKNNPLIEIMFGGWELAFSFSLIAIYELLIGNKVFKIIVRLLLILMFITKFLTKHISIEDFNAGFHNSAVVLGVVALVLILYNVIKKKIK